MINLCTLLNFHASARAENELGPRSRSPVPTSSSEDAPHAKILRLLRALHDVNSVHSERVGHPDEKLCIAESTFVNNKLTAKLTRQLEEPMIVARYPPFIIKLLLFSFIRLQLVPP